MPGEHSSGELHWLEAVVTRAPRIMKLYRAKLRDLDSHGCKLCPDKSRARKSCKVHTLYSPEKIVPRQ